MDLMGKRALQRKAFGKAIAEHGAFTSDFARCRIDLVSARLTVLDAAHALDKYGNKKVKIQQPLTRFSCCRHYSYKSSSKYIPPMLGCFFTQLQRACGH